jgi:Arc/MetJ-type ribon-helix-helix transcriptional regulator
MVVNVRTSEYLIDEIDGLVKKGVFRSRTEAVNEAMRLIIKKYKILSAIENIKAMAKSNISEESLTELLLESRREDDEDV